MESLYNKEKKLETALNRLESLSKSSTGYLGEINDLYEEKNQLKIEKKMKQKINIISYLKNITISKRN